MPPDNSARQRRQRDLLSKSSTCTFRSYSLSGACEGAPFSKTEREPRSAAVRKPPHPMRHFTLSSSISRRHGCFNPNFSRIAGQLANNTSRVLFPNPSRPRSPRSSRVQVQRDRNTSHRCKLVQIIRSPMSANPDGVEANGEQQVGQRDDAPHDGPVARPTASAPPRNANQSGTQSHQRRQIRRLSLNRKPSQTAPSKPTQIRGRINIHHERAHGQPPNNSEASPMAERQGSSQCG